MRKMKNPILAQLFMETSFASKIQQIKQLAAAEELYKIVTPAQEYPYEFICFKITGYRPKELTKNQMIPGSDLLADLPIYIAKASARLQLESNKQGQKIYSLTELTKKLNISTKTIERWQKKGLIGRRYVFPDGSLKTGFTESAVNEFTKANPALVKNASDYSTIEPELKNKIIAKARQIFQKDFSLSRTAIIKKIAAEFSRAPETIRTTIISYEKKQRKQIFLNTHSEIDPAHAAEAFKLYQDGLSVDRIAVKYGHSASSIYRIITQQRIRKLLAARIEYIPSDEFAESGAQDKILASPLSVRRTPRGILNKAQTKSEQDWQAFVDAIKKIPALNHPQESELFRRYNFLKYAASNLIKQLNLTKPCANLAHQAEQFLTQAERIKNLIIEANLHLVVQVAARHSSNAIFADLVSEGNMALMRAVEKFDYSKGQFSNYASWAIKREFAHIQPTRQPGTERSDFDEISVSQHLKTRSAGVEEIETARISLEQVITNNLTEREQHVIRFHFGLSGTMVKKEFKTLKQIGDDLGISKERVRQIELEALQKLRQTLSPEKFELLTR
jgi:RNA polymerase sigma factor (sigma-70 family)